MSKKYGQKILYISEQNIPLYDKVMEISEKHKISFSDIVFQGLDLFVREFVYKSDITPQEINIQGQTVRFLGRLVDTIEKGPTERYHFYVTSKGKILVYREDLEYHIYDSVEQLGNQIKDQDIELPNDLLDRIKAELNKQVIYLDV